MDSSQFQSLVEKYISEESTHEEVEALRQTLKDPEYVTELDNIMDQQLADNKTSADDHTEVVKRFERIIGQKINEESEVVAGRRLSFLRRWTVAAAILVIISTSGYFLFFKKSSGNVTSENTLQKIDIAPGKQGAILTLDDGSKVVLDDRGNGLVATQSGSKVLLNNGELVYDKNGLVNGQVAYNTMTTPKGRQFQLVLPDGSKVWLNAASSLRYPVVFTGNERKVEVTGEVYFEVAKNAKVPFRVKINDETEVEVIGTQFNVNCYKNEANINTTLLEGSVKIMNGDEKAIIKPGQQAQVESQSQINNEHIIKIVNDVDVEKVMAWKNGVFNFQDASLEEVMRQLERWYDIEVKYEEGIPKLEFMGKMGRDLSLSEVLRGLEISKVHFRIEENRKLVVLP